MGNEEWDVGEERVFFNTLKTVKAKDPQHSASIIAKKLKKKSALQVMILCLLTGHIINLSTINLIVFFNNQTINYRSFEGKTRIIPYFVLSG